MSSTLIILLTLVIYKLALLGVGYWASRRVSNEADFFIAGQGLGAWAAGLSYAASTSSAWVLLGFTGLVFAHGVVGLWLIPGIFAGYMLTWLVMGPRLNAETTARGHITVIDFLTADIDPGLKRLVGRVAALMILFCFVFYISSQFQAAGNAFVSIFDMNATEAILLGATVIVIYCLLGGFWAASITDALQASVMLIACILVPVAAVIGSGGMSEIIPALQTSQPRSYFSLTGGAAGFAGTGFAMGLLGTGLGALGQPQLLNRIMAAKDDKTRKQAAFITIGWGVVIYSGLVCLAFAGRAAGLKGGGESLFFTAAETYLPPVLAGVMIAAVLSAVMSTVDSLLLAAASAISHDMGISYRDEKHALFFGRVAMSGVAVLAVLLTLYLPRDIFSRVLFSWVALGAAFGPSILLKCLGIRVRGGFVLAAMIAGFSVAVISANVDGVMADVLEKWGSWLAGFLILFAGRRPSARRGNLHI